jgi:hypothetical protein
MFAFIGYACLFTFVVSFIALFIGNVLLFKLRNPDKGEEE